VRLYKLQEDASKDHIHKVIADASLPSLRAKAKALAPRIGKSEDAALSILRRAMEGVKHTKPTLVAGKDVVDLATGEVISVAR
jgi:hypothetical protein